MPTTARTAPARVGRLRRSLELALAGLRAWTSRQVLAAVLGTIAVALLIGVATVLIPNPFFGRDIPPVWWNYPVWLLTSVLSGMLMATYVAPSPGRRNGASGAGSDADADADAGPDSDTEERRTSGMGVAGGVLAWFAVGCPVCNKLALLALGYSGAITWFTPVQPFLAAGATVLLTVALVWRLGGQVLCPVTPVPEPVR